MYSYQKAFLSQDTFLIEDTIRNNIVNYSMGGALDEARYKDAIIQSPNRLRRSLSGLTATQALVKFPVIIIVICLLVLYQQIQHI